MEEAAASFDEIVSPSADAETQGPKRRSSSLTQRRRARTTVDRPMPVADAASLLGGEEATDLGDRLRERTRARRILLARRIALTLVTLALAAGGVWVAFFSPVFAFSSSAVVVSGEDGTLVTADSVRSSIASFEGVPLTRLNTQAVARAVESNVAVRSASVSRRWPTSLRVSVTMRTGMAVEAASGGYWLVDDQGVAFQQVPSAGEYPLATLPEDRATGAADIASALGALDEATRAQVASVTSTGTQVNFTLRGGQTVKWGTRGDAPQKARVLATLLANVQASTYDVSSPNHPVTS
ncbi:MAG: FtsQ-type POTRA domain-containing protein [Actinomyces sp.]|uniref:cell division protein FtsQ/DivIB n=1 Tax=Actinomyces sp. HMSC035G02 TaxID=1739406 RepID=UPI0008A8E616|nr:cell division protein FtsQ/DivIB [Actinomyces sp. HMSC035G02]MBF0937861.1 FtsQ-type POTRA domain-containing protein [Actinomyces sp.]MBS4875468.1 cell division protein FtsQ/DivIB [Actinomyces sp.]MBS5722827.1 cell division protein FtsQ/DivIB [Actinomyces sp.]MDU7041443.1 cell division protein FtsQ/DivIB [Actinomyces sp.]OHR23943.1 cell division protein FtsQ [Actinomyces sp. HMSC035G02]